MPLADFIESEDSTLGAVYTRQAGKPIKDAIFALVAFDAQQVGLSHWGTSFTPESGPALTVTGANIADILVNLALKSKCYFFGNPSITGKKPKSTPKKYGQKFGTQEIEQETGERVEIVEIMFRDYVRSQPFFNKLFASSPTLDFVLFTNTTALWVRASENSPVVHSGGYELTGNADTTAGPGSFSITWYSENGDLVHQEGVVLNKISADRVRYTFATASDLSGNLAKETSANGRERYRRTGTAAVANFTRAINEANAFVLFSIKGVSANAVTNIAKATINPTTGVVTIASDLALGTYEFQVVAENEVGVFGTYSFTLIIA